MTCFAGGQCLKQLLGRGGIVCLSPHFGGVFLDSGFGSVEEKTVAASAVELIINIVAVFVLHLMKTKISSHKMKEKI